MKKILRGALLFIGVLIWCGNGRAETENTAAVPSGTDAVALAVVGGKSITMDKFKAEMARQRGEFDADRKEELLDSIVRSELLFAAARAAGYENDPEVITAIKQAMIAKYLRDNLDPKLGQLKATDEEAEAYYQAHQEEFSIRATVHAAIIKITVSPRMSPEKKAELLQLAESARAEALLLEPGVPAFGSVAVKYSEDQGSRYRGGDIGWLQVGTEDGRFDKIVSESIAALKTPGQISAVITAADGYYIVKLIETKGAAHKPFAQVKDGVRYQVIQNKKQKIESDLIARLKGRIPVTINSALLQTVNQHDAAKQTGPPALPKR